MIRVLIIIFCFSLISCQKEDRYIPIFPPEKYLPKATQAGKNTFGCVIDEKPWLRKSRGINLLGPSINEVNYISGYFYLNIRGGEEETDETLNITAAINNTGQYILNSVAFEASFIRRLSNGMYFYYITDSTHTGLLNITRLDTINNIISGTFYFDAFNEQTQDLIKITSGRFDFKYPF